MGDVISSGYDLAKLAVGAIRVVRAPDSVTVPDDISDVVNMVAQAGSYPLKAGWLDFGATTDASSYSRGIESEGLQIEQESGDIDERITEVPRSLTFPMAHIDENNMKLIEQAPAIEQVAGASQVGPQKRVPIGTFEDVDRYRVGFIGVRSKKAGIVTEPGGATRGRMIAIFLYEASISADEASMEFAKGSLWSGEITFNAFPDNTQPEGEEHGLWLFEEASTIAA